MKNRLSDEPPKATQDTMVFGPELALWEVIVLSIIVIIGIGGGFTMFLLRGLGVI